MIDRKIGDKPINFELTIGILVIFLILTLIFEHNALTNVLLFIYFL